tara:strand:- start:891 stop:1247 length:357 start_codon:yes stop_codon:yes gene_type:complete
MAIETGVFIISVIMALGFMFYSFGKNLILAPIFKIFSIVIFFVLAVLVGSGLEVSSTTTETYQAIDPSDGSIETLTSTTTDILIDENNHGLWIGWIFFALAILNFVLYFGDYFRGRNN